MADGLLLIGGGGHCRSVLDVLERAGIPIAGIVHGPDCDMTPVCGYPAQGRDEEAAALRRGFSQALVTVGQIKSPELRMRLYALFKDNGFAFPSIVSPLAYVSPRASLGEGSIVMHHAVVNAGSSIGVNCIVNTRALVEHDCTIGDHCHIGVGAVLCGGVSVGKGSFVGAGACIRENVRIGSNSLVGMGCALVHDIPEGCRHVG